MTQDEQQPVQLFTDDRTAFRGAVLPAEFLSVTEPEQAWQAARTLDSAQRRVLALADDLSLIERALCQAAQHAPERAAKVRAAVRYALVGLEHTALCGLDRARAAVLIATQTDELTATVHTERASESVQPGTDS